MQQIARGQPGSRSRRVMVGQITRAEYVLGGYRLDLTNRQGREIDPRSDRNWNLL
jgi:hypothetical protein